MRIHNTEIASIFTKLADLLEIKGENPFRIRAYRNASRVIAGYPKNMMDLLEQGRDLTTIPGIGEHITQKIKIIVKTSELPQLKKLEARMPPVLNELMQIQSLGPKRVQILYKKLRLKTINDLKKAIKDGKIRKLKGFGEKTELKIKQGLLRVLEYSKRIRLCDAIPLVESLLAYLKKCKVIDKMECAGSYRRRKETIGDLDILVSAKNKNQVMDYFVQFNEIIEIVSQGTTRSTVRLHGGIQVDLRIVSPESFGAALLYFTGSKAHNIHIRKLAIEQNMKMNEYGIFKGDKRIAAKTEKEVYHQIKMDYIEPELREDRGEVEASLKNKLPKLIQLKNIRGDLHCHTNATDGDATLEIMANAARDAGYDYIAITDHSKHLTVVHGLNEKRLMQQIKVIDNLNMKLKNIRILKSIEMDILEDGRLDLPDRALKELDFTVCSIHSKFDLSEKKQTERIIRAMDNPYFNILAHPNGRLINRREPYALNLERVMHAAKDRGCFLELNAQPERIDLNDLQCMMAKDMGLKLVISTDAHSVSQLQLMQFGIDQARRGWLEANDVINTLSLQKLLRLLKRK